MHVNSMNGFYFVLAPHWRIISHYSRWVSLNPQIFYQALGNTTMPLNRRNGFLFWSSSALMQHKPLLRFLWFSRSSRGHQHCRMMDGWMVGWLAGHKARNPFRFLLRIFSLSAACTLTLCSQRKITLVEEQEWIFNCKQCTGYVLLL